MGLSLVLLYKRQLRQGVVYDIANFTVYKVKGRYRPVHHEYLIYFKKETNLISIEDPTLSFPQEKFEFVDFADIPLRKDNMHLTGMPILIL